MNRVNYAKELEKIIQDIGRSSRGAADFRPPGLLLHCCCAPCSSYCLMYLLPYFDITCFYYNPNITDKEEYDKRLAELHRFADAVNALWGEFAGEGSGAGEQASSKSGIFTPVKIIDGEYEPEKFLENVSKEDLSSCPEGGRRCEMCFSMRLQKTYEMACDGGFDYFTTTLTISPLKDAQLINSIGMRIAEAAPSGKGSALWLPSDFKKNDGYKISIELSQKFGLYRQDYCGCIFSRRDKDKETGRA